MGAAQLSAQQLTRKTDMLGVLRSEALQGQLLGSKSAPQSRVKSGNSSLESKNRSISSIRANGEFVSNYGLILSNLVFIFSYMK